MNMHWEILGGGVNIPPKHAPQNHNVCLSPLIFKEPIISITTAIMTIAITITIDFFCFTIVSCLSVH